MWTTLYVMVTSYGNNIWPILICRLSHPANVRRSGTKFFADYQNLMIATL